MIANILEMKKEHVELEKKCWQLLVTGKPKY